MKRLLSILLATSIFGAGCASSDDAGFVVNGSTMIVPGSMGGEINAGASPLVPPLSVGQ